MKYHPPFSFINIGQRGRMHHCYRIQLKYYFNFQMATFANQILVMKTLNAFAKLSLSHVNVQKNLQETGQTAYRVSVVSFSFLLLYYILLFPSYFR